MVMPVATPMAKVAVNIFTQNFVAAASSPATARASSAPAAPSAGWAANAGAADIDAIMVTLASTPAAARPFAFKSLIVSPYSTVNMNWVSY